MKAMIYQEYGSPDVLNVANVEEPEVGNTQIKIRVRATSVSAADIHMRQADPFAVRLFNGLITPKRQILGTEFSGEIVATGNQVKNFAIGDRVFGGTGTDMGANAEFLVLDESAAIAKIPNGLTFEQAAAIPFGATASLYFLHHKIELKAGQRVLINGAGGALGCYGVQLARYKGAEVIAICRDDKRELLLRIGAKRTWDYSKAPVSEMNERFDVVYDTHGSLKYAECEHLLTEKGIWISAAGGVSDFARMMILKLFGQRQMVAGLAIETQSDMNYLKRLVETGDLVPVIDSVYDLDDLVAAHRYVEKGHKTGCVVIRVS
ncbi:NADPH:quinone reductase [Vibrio nigripulchritudo ATCC 27043]|uniref:NAD(P)-dependent alcohol dehydrogenase n=1 Tax=Vibrio nigripulchritudo TaxID=28173 RepID=UPI00021C1157|nr:NAD(P)-dependent alcohol dehydrogenase [Vibrio nigripulchritudo]EGU57499.1 NADPH:quinone reductase [Vibrio nigripulchritudo ATCC 27043]